MGSVAQHAAEWLRGRDTDRRDLDTLREAIRLGDESGSSIRAETVFAELRDAIARRRAQG
ncbi:hypothetical protein [Gluconacetobacter tumulisoli]|uniref:hypothetical protein n=1 Tax=Gluconacetobacter tumulisoli TaxID=1286189 RepID=UPI001FEBD81F|nr:hypothetical protein [Gluconacetobacter tumulisoli]